MGERPCDNPLRKEILGAKQKVVLLRGPAASGKTFAVLDAYRHFTGEDFRSRCLLIAPGYQAVRDLKNLLLQGSPSSLLVGPSITTFAGLAGRIFAAAGEGARTITPVRRHLLLRQIVDDLAKRRKLAALSPVADTPGVVVMLDRAIAELKRAAIDPPALARVARQPKAADLLEIYTRYQDYLQANGLYDVEGRMWQARDLLRRWNAEGPASPAMARALNGAVAAAVDGFTDFTPTQLEMLALLAPGLERLILTLPLDDADPRHRMWRWTDRTLRNIRERFGGELHEIALGDPPSGPALRPLWRKVFDFDAKQDALPAGMNILAASSPEAEVTAVAGRVKELLLRGAGRIAVTSRAIEAYREPVERIFREYGIDVAPAAAPLPQCAIVRFALDAAALAPQLEYQAVLGVIKNSYFRPQAMGPFDALAVAAAETIIREGNVLSGRESYRHAVRRLAARTVQPSDENDEPAAPSLDIGQTRPEALAAGGAMLDKLFDLSQAANSPAGLRAMIASLELAQAAMTLREPALVARDLRALAELDETLSGMGEPEPDLAAMREALSAASCPSERTTGLVEVVGVLDLRPLRCQHLFILGAGEGQFPARIAENPLLGESQRAAWRRQGVTLDSPGDLLAREMLLFYLAISRPDVSLTVSYVETGAGAADSSAGGFLLSLLEPFGGLGEIRRSGAMTVVPPGQLVPPGEGVGTPRQAILAGLAGAFDADLAQQSGALEWACRNRPGQVEQAARGLWSRSRRWQKGPCDNFDGRITDPDLQAQLARRFGEEAVFSASQFDTFLGCPWHFFATYVLRLSPLAQPQRRLEAVTRGVFCHNALFRLFTNLRKDHGTPVRLDAHAEKPLLAALERAVDEEAADAALHRPDYPALWEQQIKRMHADLAKYVLEQRAAAAAGEHFELGFGMERRGDDRADPASRPEPVTIAAPQGTFRLRGKVDRVDLLPDGSALWIVDYKTGALPAAGAIENFGNLQLPLYLEAVEQILGKPCAGGAFHGIASAAVRTFPRKECETPEEYADLRRRAMARAAQAVQQIRQGQFDLPRECPRSCDFRHICQFSRNRSAVKAPAAEDAP